MNDTTMTVETQLISEEGMLNLMDLLRPFLDILLLLFFSLDSGQHRELYLLVLHDGRNTVCFFPDTGNNNFYQLAKVESSPTELGSRRTRRGGG